MANLRPTDQFDKEILDLVNQARRERGLQTVQMSEELDKAADDYSKVMAREDHFSHTGPDGSSPGERLRRAGFTGGWGENIAAGQRSAQQVFNGWMNSSGHRANILRASHTHMGLGYDINPNAQYGTRWTQLFGSGDSNPGVYRPETIGGSPSPNPAPSPNPTPSPNPNPNPSPSPNPNPNPSPTNLVPTDQFDKEILDLVNQARTSRGLRAVRMSEELDSAADDYSKVMARENHFSHTGPDGSSPGERLRKAGFTGGWGENIAAGQRSAQQVFDGWMNSSGHRANILRASHTHMGLGYARNSSARYGTRWTQLFGSGDSNPGVYRPETIGGSPSPNPNPSPSPNPTPNPTPTPSRGVLDFDDLKVQSYGGNQDVKGSVRKLNGGRTLNLRGNTWKKVDLPYNVRPDTVLEFQFRSSRRGEIHGIGFDNDNAISSNRTFKLHGSQNWGIQNFDNYGRSNRGWKSYRIPVGQFYTGNFSHLTFTNDHDVRSPRAASFFRNVKVYNRSDVKGMIASFGGDGDDMLQGTAARDILSGGAGNDTLSAMRGSDRLIGVDPKQTQAGIGEVDTLNGGRGSDTFVLGDASQIYYDDHNADTLGTTDYALIGDFRLAQGDTIQLSGSADQYSLGATSGSLPEGTAIYTNNEGEQKELIGVVKGANNLSLTSPAFTFA